GGAAGGAVAEGLGALSKAGIATAVTVSATAALLWALSGFPEPAPKQDARPPAAQPVVPLPTLVPPTSSPAPEPPPAPQAAPAPKPTPTPTPTPTHTLAPTSTPVRSAQPTPGRPTGTPGPTEAPPRPTPSLTPTPTPPPAPAAEYRVSRLKYNVFGDHTGPELRLGGSSWLWQRYGMSIGGRTYAHGITVHPRSSVTIDLNRECSTYAAFVGVDDMSRRLGSVRFSVYGDGVRLWRSPVVAGGEPAVPVRVDIAGRKSIRLVAEPAGRFGAVTSADWAEARISCSGK
uniref:NPCBM/NEW2 domain-containing protein n=1 Tax=Streptomyces sp. TRM49041 TaxID=2603216 RepID=UPI00165683AE